MSSGISIKVKRGWAHFYNVHIRSMSDLDNQIKEAEDNIKTCKEKLKMLAAATPKDIFPPTADNYGDCLFSVNKEFDSIWEWLEEEQATLSKLYHMKDLITDWEFKLYEDDPNEEVLNINNIEDFQKICPDPYRNN